MKFGKYFRVIGLAISFPGTILSLAFGVSKLVEYGLVSRNLGFGIFFIVIFNILWLMIKHALSKKN